MIHIGDCRSIMANMDAESIDAIVCDPPYELGFMGKAWDCTGIAFDPKTWEIALRVAKPGAFLVAFGGSRTHHRVACAIEDAGWEVPTRPSQRGAGSTARPAASAHQRSLR